jgi:molybdopterin-guanine dinucleotide biosynthesis protein A
MPDASAKRETLVLLAGGRATRLPEKLVRSVEGVPLIVRAYRRFASAFDVVVSHAEAFPAQVEALLDCPRVLDRWPARGPLGGMLSACQTLQSNRLFVLAADLPHVEARTLDALRSAWVEGDEAVVPVHAGGIEPLAALYDRRALLREGLPIMLEGNAAVHAVVARLRVRTVAMDSTFFTNLNTPEDWHRIFAS